MFGSIPPDAMEKINNQPLVRLQRGVDSLDQRLAPLDPGRLKEFLGALGDKAMGALGALKDLGRRSHDEQMRAANNMRG